MVVGINFCLEDFDINVIWEKKLINMCLLIVDVIEMLVKLLQLDFECVMELCVFDECVEVILEIVWICKVELVVVVWVCSWVCIKVCGQ